MRSIALLLALLATPALAEVSRHADQPLHGIATGHDVSEPGDLMRLAAASCLLWGPDLAAEELTQAGWTREEGEITTLTRGEVEVDLLKGQGWCDVSSPVLLQSEARAIAEDLLRAAYGEPLGERTEELGCAVLWSEAAPGASIMLAGPGSDESSCWDTGQPGAVLNLYIQ